MKGIEETKEQYEKIFNNLKNTGDFPNDVLLESSALVMLSFWYTGKKTLSNKEIFETSYKLKKIIKGEKING